MMRDCMKFLKPRQAFICFAVLVLTAFHPALAYAKPAPLNGEMAEFKEFKNLKRLPPLQFETEDGAKFGNDHFKGKVILLNIWATWCGPCRSEMPSLNKLQKKFGKDRFEVVTLSVDRTGRDRVQPFFKEHKLDALTMYFDKGAYSMDRLNINGVPTSYIIDAAGRMRGIFQGETDWGGKDAEQLIQYYLDDTSQNTIGQHSNL